MRTLLHTGNERLWRTCTDILSGTFTHESHNPGSLRMGYLIGVVVLEHSLHWILLAVFSQIVHSQSGLNPFLWSQRTWKLHYSLAQTALGADIPAKNVNFKTLPGTQNGMLSLRTILRDFLFNAHTLISIHGAGDVRDAIPSHETSSDRSGTSTLSLLQTISVSSVATTTRNARCVCTNRDQASCPCSMSRCPPRSIRQE